MLLHPIITLITFISTFVLNCPRILFQNSQLIEKLNGKSFSMLTQTYCIWCNSYIKSSGEFVCELFNVISPCPCTVKNDTKKFSAGNSRD